MKIKRFTKKTVSVFFAMSTLIAFSMVGCTGCVSFSNIAEIIPENDFDELEYHRSAGGWTKDIEAKGGKRNNDEMKIEDLSIKTTCPVGTIEIVIKGYTQKIDNNDTEEVDTEEVDTEEVDTEEVKK